IQCDQLDLQFARKAQPEAPRSETSGKGNGPLEIDEARATGKLVILTSDAERLHARGTELIYSKSRRISVLRGEPLSAVKEGHRIQARELVLHQTDKKSLAPALEPVRQASAQG